MGNFYQELERRGARAPVVEHRRASAVGCVDAASLDGAAALPTLSEVLGWDVMRRAEVLNASTQRAAELQGLLEDRLRFNDYTKIRNARAWHNARVRVIQSAQQVERARRSAEARAGIAQAQGTTVAARLARLASADRRFVEAAKRLLSSETYELIWDEAALGAEGNGADHE